MPYATIPVATVVGGTPKLCTIPDSATGKDATLKDMIICPSAIAIIGTQDSRVAGDALVITVDCVVIACLPNRIVIGPSRRKRRLADQASGFETNRSMPSRCDRNLATSCPLMLFPARSRGGANVPSPPLLGDTVTIPPPIPLLPGRPML